MVRIPKSVLWWSPNQDGCGVVNAVLTNKEVWLHAGGVYQETPFAIRRCNLLGRIPHIGRSRWGGWVQDILTESLGGGAMRSRTYWLATNDSSDPMSSVSYYFMDRNGGESGTLAVANTPTYQFKSARYSGLGLRPKVDANLSFSAGGAMSVRAELAEYRRGFEINIGGEVLAPRDPEVEIEILEPGKSRDLLLQTASEVLSYEVARLPSSEDRTHQVEMFSDGHRDQYVVDALNRVGSFLGPRDVDFSTNRFDRFIAAPDEPSSASVTLRGEGPVRLIFAVRIHDRDTGTNSISEFMPVIVTPPRAG